jgi:hypothetical protein
MTNTISTAPPVNISPPWIGPYFLFGMALLAIFFLLLFWRGGNKDDKEPN